ncbi:hypothetical protein SCMU_14130 [Sinomonas cyclohexanicum]|uniref:Uncharacterized protein n=1 Tax=Sinomonas cyclohexanicum TaxID=322009 RepID=A0ABM7PTJ8_SINCY|nr:hypothetical protein [Corynebacterium cyclohexanicum]BCT75571.1 hypothetical protein SCMU_14130 [Corynebacterium cyclohexanicum]
MTAATAPTIHAGSRYYGSIASQHGKTVAFTEACRCWGCQHHRDPLFKDLPRAHDGRDRKVTLEDGTVLYHPNPASFRA